MWEFFESIGVYAIVLSGIAWLIKSLTAHFLDKKFKSYEKALDRREKRHDQLLKKDLEVYKLKLNVERLKKERLHVRGIDRESFIEGKDVSFEEALKMVLNFVGTPVNYWESNDLEGKKKLHGLIFKELPLYNIKNGFGTPEISLPFRLEEGFLMSKSQNVGAKRFAWNTLVKLVFERRKIFFKNDIFKSTKI